MAERAMLGVGSTHSYRLVDSSQDGNASSWNATSVDAYRNGRHLGNGRRSVYGEADEITGEDGVGECLLCSDNCTARGQLVEQDNSEERET